VGRHTEQDNRIGRTSNMCIEGAGVVKGKNQNSP
jgi:hypothetical protein